MFKIEPTLKITKEFIFSKISQEQVFEHYLGIQVTNKLFCSPSILRKDNNPTCTFYKNAKGILKLKDFASDNLDCIAVVMKIFTCTYYTALRIICNDFGLIKTNVEKNPPKIEYSGKILKETEKSRIEVVTKEFSQKELDWWKSFGVSKKSLDKFNIFSIKSIFLNGNYFNSSSESCPIYGYYGGADNDGVNLWRLYMPTKRNYRFISNWSSNMIQGAKQLPKSGEFLIITKSLKDVVSLYEYGIIAIAPCSETLFLSENQYSRLKARYKEIFLLYDKDLPGVKASQKIRKNFPDINVLLMPKTKDFTDYVKKYGTLKTLNLIEEWQERRKSAYYQNSKK